MVSLMFFSEKLYLEVKLQNYVTTNISKCYKVTNKVWVMYLEG